MTVASISVEILSTAIIKFVIAAVVLLFIFVASKLLVSCLSNKKPKKNKNPYPKQIYMNLETKKNQNEFNIGKSGYQQNFNQIQIAEQIVKQEKNNLPFIEDLTDN